MSNKFLRAVLITTVFLLFIMIGSSFNAQAEGTTNPVAQTEISSETVDKIANLYGVSETGLYVVRFTEPSLASYTGGITGLAATSPEATGESRLDANSPAAVAYTDFLTQQHNEFAATMEQTLDRSVEVAFDYKAALNGMAVRVSHEEAAQLAAMPGVLAVYGDTERELTTDVGPGLIGAPAIWDGDTGPGLATRGEGVIIGVIDSGINSQHPAFAATDGDGYVHTNPYGAGTYLGWCAANAGFCNAKLIAAYGLNPVGGSPEDTDGHGSHTASTAGGNAHIAAFNVGADAYNIPIQGVAPRANIVAYKVCNPGCPGTASIAAVNSAIATDEVDVLNYSISGSDSPWTDPVDLAFLDASNAGIYVSASAGNSGPGPSTVAKTGPWNASTAASTHNRAIVQNVDVTGPTTPPELQDLAAVPGEGTSIASNINSGIRYDATNNLGCTAFAAGTFTGNLALIQRGSCAFSVKVTNAVAAGATGVVLFNSVSGPPLTAGGLTGTPPVVMLTLEEGLALRDYVVANPTTATVEINSGTQLVYVDEWEDIVAGFSSRGPSQFEILKPDYIAPGVNILAAVAADGANAVQYGFLQGTSMSSPHGAGAAALMVALHPTWSPAEIKSAMASTAVGGLLKEDGVTPADPFDVGSGRLDLSLASTVGLVFNETGANYAAADPAIGGDPKTLNQPSVVNYSCVGQCSWTRTVKSVLATSATYTATVSGPAGMNITVTPSTFTIAPGAEQVLTINAEISALPVGAFAFGSVTLSTPVEWPADAPIAPMAVLLNEGFEDATFPPTGWAAFNVDGGGTQWVRNIATPHSGVGSAYHQYSTAGMQEGWLISPQIDLLDGASQLTFWQRDTYSFGNWYNYHGVLVTTDADPNPATATYVELWAGDIAPTWTETIIDLSAYAGEQIYIAFKYMGNDADDWRIDDVMVDSFASGGFSVADTNVPVVVKPAAAILPEAVSIETMFRSGSEDVTGLLVGDEITDLTVEVGGLFAAQMVDEELSQDPTNGDPYNGDGGTFFITTTVPAGALRLIAEITQSEAPDLDLYVGTGDTPSAATEECVSAGGSWTEFCAIDNPTAGTWWMLVQNWQGSASQPDWVTLAAAIVTESDEANMTVDGPATVAPGVEFDVTVNWDEPAMVAGEKWYGFFTLGTDAGNPGNIGAVWVDLLYTGAPSATVDPALGNYQPGDMVMTTTLSIGNIGDAPLTWSIVEQAPPTSAAAGTVATLPNAATLAGLTAQSGSLAASTARAPEAEVLWEQVVNGTSGIVSDFFIGSDAGAYSASDFVLTDFATIEYIYAAGFDNTNTLANQPAINWAIYANASGVPAGHPEDGSNMGSALWSYSAPVNGTGVDITGNNIALDLLAAGEDLYLAPGTYWLSVYPDYNVTGAGGARWNWYQAAQVGAQTQLVSPVIFGVSNWTSLGGLGLTFFDTAFRIEGTPGQLCDPGDIPWLSLPETSGTVEGGESAEVPVVFDSTGLADGTYTGQLCITTNDPAEPIHFVDVELTVGEFASLRVAHLAPFAMDPGTAVTVTLNGAPALTDFAYGDSTSYIELVPDTYLVEIFPGSSASPAITGTVNLMADMYYSAVAIGDGVNQDLALLALADDNTAPAAGKFHLRLGHLAPFAAGAATADIRLQDGTIVVDDVDFSDVTAFIPLDAGTYDLKITTPDGATTLIDPLPVTFAEGDIVTAFATGEGENQALGVFAWPVDVEGFFLPLFEEYELFLPVIFK